MLTHDGKIFLIALGSILALYVLSIAAWAVWCVFKRNGICPMPKITLFGFWGIAVAPWLLLVAIDYRSHAGLLAHEQWHQGQQRKDGTLRYWWRYWTSKQARLYYEVSAYREWVRVKPGDMYLCVYWLRTNYGLRVSDAQARELLMKPNI